MFAKNFIADLENRIVIVKNVLSQVCSQCGEVSYSQEVAVQLEKIVNNMRTSAMEVAFFQYGRSA